MKYILIILMTITNLCVSAQSLLKAGNRLIVFTNVNVVAMNADSIQANKTVVVQNGRVLSISNATSTAHPKNAIIVDGKGKYLMPGLAEMHAHVPPIDDIEPMKEVLLLFAVNGVTTIRGMLGHPRHLELRAKIRAGEIPGPHFYTSGPSFNGNTVTNEQQAAAKVKEQKTAGYDFLKLHPGLTLANFNAVAAAAKKEGIPFAGHVSYDVGIWRAIEAGYATVDHMDGFVESLVPGIKSIPENQTGLFATFIGHQADTSAVPKLVSALKTNNI
ncbi:MAG: amidohydrolase, partial [Chitinophagaceae bacterium]